MTDLARLVVALEAQTAKYQQGLDAANRKLEKFQRDQNTRLASIGKRFDGFVGGVRGALAAIGVGVTFRAIIKATAEAEAAFAQLDDAVRQTGGSAGFTAQQLADYATELQKITTFGDEEIQNLEQVLLRFRSIQGNNFTRTTAAVLDLATALKVDLASAGKLLGKALEDPVTGMSALSRAGVVLGAEQKELIKDLAQTGKHAEAQSLLLDELEKRYGGAAVAARDNFGGALKGLSNAFGDLLEGKSGMNEATAAINSLTDTLNSDEVKQGFAAIVGGFIKIVEVAARAAAEVVSFTKFIAESFAAFRNGPAEDDLVRTSDAIIASQNRIEQLEASRARRRGKETEYIGRAIEAEKQKLEQLEAQYARGRKAAEEAAAAALKASRAAGAGGINVPKPGEYKQLSPARTSIDAELQEVEVLAERIGDTRTALDKYYDELDDRTKTSYDKMLEQWEQLDYDIAELAKSGRYSAEELQARYEEAFDELGLYVEVTAKKVGDSFKAQTDELSEFVKEAQRNIENQLGSAIEDAMAGRFDNILKGFVQLINRMVAQALAAKLAEKLFGTGQPGGGGWIGAGLSALGSIFGGGRDSGGRGSAGKAYRIGVGAQPEYFVPDSPGTFYPRGEGMGGAAGVVQNFIYEKPPTARTSRQMQRDSVRGQAIAARLM